MAFVSITAAVLVRRRVVRFMRWGHAPDGGLRVWRPDGSLLYPADEPTCHADETLGA